MAHRHVHACVLSCSCPHTTFLSPSFLCRVVDPPYHIVIAPPPFHCVIVVWCLGCCQPALDLVLRCIHHQLQDKRRRKRLTYGPGDINVSWALVPTGHWWCQSWLDGPPSSLRTSLSSLFITRHPLPIAGPPTIHPTSSYS